MLHQLKRDAAREAGDRLVIAHRNQRLELLGDAALHPMHQAPLDLLDNGWLDGVVDESLCARRKQFVPLDQLAYRGLVPDKPALFGHAYCRVGREIEPVCPAREFPLERAQRGRAQGLDLIRRCSFVHRKAEAVDPAQILALDGDLALVVHLGHEPLLLLQPPHQHARAPVDKSLRQAGMKRVRQPVLDRAGRGLPLRRILDPSDAIGDIGPGPDIGEPLGQRIDVTVGAVDAPDLPCDPVGRYTARRP